MNKLELNEDQQKKLEAELFDNAKIPLRLAVKTESGFPTIVALWSLREDGKIYCATRARSYVVSKIKAESKVGFEVSTEAPPYKGVRGWGRARIVPERGEEILRRLLIKYLGGVDSPLARKLLLDMDGEVAIEIEPVWIKGWDFTPRMRDSIPKASS